MSPWQRLEAVVVEAFTGKPEIQARARDAVHWLKQRSLDSPRRKEALARVAMCSGEVAPGDAPGCAPGLMAGGAGRIPISSGNAGMH